jgi:hypothetical protein
MSFRGRIPEFRLGGIGQYATDVGLMRTAFVAIPFLSEMIFFELRNAFCYNIIQILLEAIK